MKTDKVAKTARDIKTLRIQGASKVRKAALDALLWKARHAKAAHVPGFRKEMRDAVRALGSARPTEPGMRTALRTALAVLEHETESVHELRDALAHRMEAYEENRVRAMARLAHIGARTIPKNAVVLTHCHSNTVVSILKEARKRIRHAYCTETRPRFQGRTTATELAKAGIATTLLVDNAASTVLKEADVFITGSDAVLADGSLVNKIGTHQISIAAQRFGTPHVVATSTYKFDPVTVFGHEEIIEQREPKEVWEKAPKKVEIENPAFDLTPPQLIRYYITEEGLLAPQEFALHMYQKLELDKREREYTGLFALLQKKGK